MTDPTKPGVRSSEFWYALLTPAIAVYGVLAVQFGWTVTTDTLTNSLPVVAAVAVAISSHGYSRSRAVVKQAALDNAVVIPNPPVPPVGPPSNLTLALAQFTDAA